MLSAGLQGLSQNRSSTGKDGDAAANSAAKQEGGLRLECRVCPATGEYFFPESLSLSSIPPLTEAGRLNNPL